MGRHKVGQENDAQTVILSLSEQLSSFAERPRRSGKAAPTSSASLSQNFLYVLLKFIDLHKRLLPDVSLLV